MTREASPSVQVPRLRPYLGRLWHGWQDQRTLSRVHNLAPLILRQAPAIPGAPPTTRWRVLQAQWSQTGVVVLVLGTSAGSPVAVLKAAYGDAAAEGLQLQTRTLAALHEEGRLRDWRSLLPRIMAVGEIAGLRYTLQEALPGVDAALATGDQARRLRLMALAAEGIRPLHQRTAELARADDSFLAQVVGQPIELIRRAVRSELPLNRDQAIERLKGELYHALVGRELWVSWIHGDLWLGNVLISPDEAKVTGIIDWSMAGRRELALHDVLHLILHARQVMQHQELGDTVRAALMDAEWQPHERILLEAEELSLPLHKGAMRTMVLLYWLRRLSSIFEQGRGHARNGVWVAWNIDRVLQCL